MLNLLWFLVLFITLSDFYVTLIFTTLCRCNTTKIVHFVSNSGKNLPPRWKSLASVLLNLFFFSQMKNKKLIFLRVQQIFRKCFESWQFKLIFAARLLAESWHEGVIDYNSRCIIFIQKWKILFDFKYQNYSCCWVGRINEYFEKKFKKH